MFEEEDLLDHDDAHHAFERHARVRSDFYDVWNYPEFCEEITTNSERWNMPYGLDFWLFAVRDIGADNSGVLGNDAERVAGNIHSWPMVAVRIHSYWYLTNMHSTRRALNFIEDHYEDFKDGNYSIIACAFF